MDLAAKLNIAIVIRENGLHRIHRDIAPVFLDEIAHSIAPRAGIGETIGFAGCKP